MEGTMHYQTERAEHPAYAMDSPPPLGLPTPTPPSGRLPLGTTSDTALALALIAGDIQAPQAAWARYVPMVYGMLRRTFGADHRVEDLIQDVFFILFRKVRGLREPNALKAYVISITSMTIKYELRRKRTLKQLRLSDAVSQADRLTTEQPDAGAREALVSFYALLDRLSETDRKAFILRFFEGLGIVEVALALDVSVSTAKRRLTRIRKRVATLIRNSPALAAFLEGLAPPDPAQGAADQNETAFASCWISAASSARL
jgi:RNA polymerase sigma-70 factor (ECF subfamily)